MSLSDKQSRLFSILKELACDPETFEAFLRYLSPGDMEAAWEVVGELAQANHPAINNSADLLAQWCTGQLLKRIHDESLDRH